MAADSATWRLAGRVVRVSHLDKLYWPDDRLTKGDLLRYYRDIAPVLLPYCANRPATLHVFPDGIEGHAYYQRDRPRRAPRWLRTVDYQTATDAHRIHTILIDDVAGLIWLANTGAIEFHLWGSRLPNLAEPDQAIFDLDPGDQATFADVLQAALRLRAALERLGLRGYPKTSGGRGLHVYLPLAPGHTFDAVRAWVKTLAARLAAEHPELIAVARGATHRGHQVTIDHAQNSIGRNTAAPYTVRALPRAPVSAPLTWEEIAAGEPRPADLTLATVPARVRARGDLFAPVLQGGQRLPPL
jgi:bifunctional non-homologous end joining protein LigD